jgi:hypothetical protein
VEAATSGLLPLCYKTLHAVVTDSEPWLVTGNKLAIKDIHRLVDYLFNIGRFYVQGSTKRERLHWGDMTYRTLFSKCYTVLKLHVS